MIAVELSLDPGVVYVNAHRVMERLRAVCREFDEELTDDDDSGLPERS